MRDSRDQRPTVVHVVEPEPPGQVGGADLHVLDLAAAQMAHSSFRPLVLMWSSEDYAHRLESAGVPYIPGHRISPHRLMMARQLGNLPRSYRVAMIHSHGYDGNYVTYLLKVMHRQSWGQIPTVMSCHGWIEDTFYHRMKTKADFFTYRTAEALITSSQQQLARLQQERGKRLVRYVPNGICIPDDAANAPPSPSLRERLNVPASSKLVAAVGRLSPEKRLDVYLEACQILAQNHNRVHFFVVGSGEQRTSLQHKADELGLNERVTFTGLVDDVDLIYQGLDILLITSDTEGTPRVALEAMARSIPVIATKVGGLSQIVDHGVTGFLAPQGNAQAIAAYALDLLRDERRRRLMGQCGRQKALEQFSILRMQQDIEAVYHDLTRNRNNLQA